MAHDSMPWVGWGCALADFDNDGWPDCFVANGHVDDNLELLGHETSLRRARLAAPQPRRASGFGSRRATPGPTSTPTTSAAGVAFGDLDDDGDIDIVVNHKDGAAGLAAQRHPDAPPLDSPAPGGHAQQSRRDRRRVEVEAGAGRSSASARESYRVRPRPPAPDRAGEADVARRVTIRWPSGQVDHYSDLPADTGYLVREGTGLAEPL